MIQDEYMTHKQAQKVKRKMLKSYSRVIHFRHNLFAFYSKDDPSDLVAVAVLPTNKNTDVYAIIERHIKELKDQLHTKPSDKLVAELVVLCEGVLRKDLQSAQVYINAWQSRMN